MSDTPRVLPLPQPADGRINHQDLIPGTYGLDVEKHVTRDEIIAFARSYDPQPIHLDEAAARASIVGGLCASGYHTCSMLMRLICDGFLNRSASQGAPGIDEMKWLRPVRPGDVLTARFSVGDKRVMASRPHIGISSTLWELSNQNGEVVASWEVNQFIRVRHPQPIAAGATSPGSGSNAEAARTTARQSLWDLPARSADDPNPAERRGSFFDDREVGEVSDLGSHTFTKDEIIAFARLYDPQPFHLDEAAAKASLFGGLAASGWHTAAIYIRHLIGHRQKGEARMRAAGIRPAVYGPSPGFKNLRWTKPVMVGDTISFRARISDKIDLRSRPDRGLLMTESQGRNQKGEVVFTINSQFFAERREPYVLPA